ncbi:MAG: hypothetical protein EOS82_09570 [Mesorhizobium sp.]|uniref:Tc toxin subunit A-related protein n=4 Tax=Mesorhizobium sp. TaxID=1871066 RepID=UPI000FE70D10|nr:hypothetical protein [Mesorhizobium sp.]RWQ53308.1 MAG: hypothetical protein EOS82_09570 [Mesorhizobium sp.]
MPGETELPHVNVQVLTARFDIPLANVAVEALLLDCGRDEVVGQSLTEGHGIAELALPSRQWGRRIEVRLAGEPEFSLELSREHWENRAPAILVVKPSEDWNRDALKLFAEQLMATRRIGVDLVMTEVAAPSPDSAVQILSPSERARLLDGLQRMLDRADASNARTTTRFLDPEALRAGDIKLVPVRDIRPPDLYDEWPPDFEVPKIWPIWSNFPWSAPDDQSYRDYLRSVFVLFAHQQKLGVGADPKTFPDIVELQLKNRFHQDFRTADRSDVPLDTLLIDVVTRILTAPVAGFGFGLAAASIPAQGTNTLRQRLDALLALAPIDRQEFANRYRLPLGESDDAVSSPVKLNIHTLSRTLSDTAQGPVERNRIDPQLPGEQEKPILWQEVVGSAPFFLRYDEWLAQQQPFFPENLFALRTQVIGTSSGPWLTEPRKKFLEYHLNRPTNLTVAPYNGYFGSTHEVHRSAKFLLAYGAADAKLTELVQAIDRNQFATAARLADEAEKLLVAAHPEVHSGEDWEPSTAVGNLSRPLSFARRRKLTVSNIAELSGTRRTYPADGFEHFFELERPDDQWGHVVHFRIARDQATRLRTYQLHFMLKIFRATIFAGLGDLPAAVQQLGEVTGYFIGIAGLRTAAGMVKHPEALGMHRRVVAGRLRWDDPLGDRPYTARVMYDQQRRLIGPFPLTPQIRGGYEVLKPDTPWLHRFEERYAEIAQGDAILAWAEALYRSDDPASLERARELYKAVIFLHGEDPGTSAYFVPRQTLPWYSFAENPRIRNQVDRARLALLQLASGLNFYGYNDEAVPTLNYSTLLRAAHRWATGAKSAQSDYLTYLTRVEQLDLDLLAAKTQERKASAAVAITAEQVEIAKAGVVAAQKVVADVEKLIAAKQSEIEDANSIFTQFKDYFTGMKSSVSSMVDVGKGASEGWTSLSTSGVGEALGLGAQGGSGTAAAGTESVGLGSAMGGLAVVGGFAAFAVLSTTTLQGMADAANKRQGELMALKNEALKAAQAGVRVQERYVTIANLQAQIAATDLAYTRDLISYQNERFLNRDFWEALAGVAQRSLRRYLDLAGQASWFAERALAYRLGTSIRVIRIGYFDLKMRDVGSVDRLELDLAELEALRLAAVRLTVPLTVTYALARDLPLAFGALKSSGRCTFTLTDDDLVTAFPGTFAHRIRSIDVMVDAPGTPVPVRGMLTNSGFSLLRREAGGARVPLLRFPDALPVSEFRLRSDMATYEMPGEQLLPFEGTAFTTTWMLELPRGGNAVGLNRITDVRLTFNIQAAYEAGLPPAPALPQALSRSTFVSALAIDPKGLQTLRDPAKAQGKLQFDLDRLALPANATITNLAVLLPGVDGGTYSSKIRFGGGAATSFKIEDGLAMSNAGVLSDNVAANRQRLNAAASGSPARPATVTITKGTEVERLQAARDALLWMEYNMA